MTFQPSEERAFGSGRPVMGTTGHDGTDGGAPMMTFWMPA
jgi:hypothetical protein